MTPDLTLPEDRAIGSGHRSSANEASAKATKDGNVLTVASYIRLIKGPFIIEVFSGSGRLAKAVRDKGIQCFEFDLTTQGGCKNLLHAHVLTELKGLIAHPQCKGVWFGYPCGAFRSARRHDGGPPPLRGTNPKDIGGLPHLAGRELARARNANKLLLLMNEPMKDCESSNVPFYIGNPQSSRVWLHPIVRKWTRHTAPHKV